MPIYEYQCYDCKKKFEKIQRLSEPLISTCPFCGGGVYKCFSVPALQFKGNGFYITDYKKRGSQSSNEGSEKKKSEKSTSSKNDGGLQ